MSTVRDYWTDSAIGDISRSAARITDALKLIARDEGDDWISRYSLRRAIADAAEDRRTGFEFELSKELTDRAGAPLSHNGFLVPWSVFTRADLASTTTAGGYLVDTKNLPAADALRPNMLIGRRGCTFIDAGTGNVSLPTQTAVATGGWLPIETSQASEVNQTFGQANFSPHTYAGYTEVSRLLLQQAGPSPAESVVRRDLVNVVARGLDAAAIAGTGVNGQPHGVIGTTGVQTFSGTTLALTGIVNAAVALGDALNTSAGVIANRTTAGLLRTRQEVTGGTRCLWEGSLIEGNCVGFGAGSNTVVPTGGLLLGSWVFLNIAVWSSGVEVLVNPYDQSNFKAGIVGIRAMLTADVGLTYPAAFNYAATVT